MIKNIKQYKSTKWLIDKRWSFILIAYIIVWIFGFIKLGIKGLYIFLFLLFAGLEARLWFDKLISNKYVGESSRPRYEAAYYWLAAFYLLIIILLITLLV